jgi:death-on-curing protein
MSSPTTSVSSPTPKRSYRYLDFPAAVAVVDSARARALELGDPRLAPPVPLTACDLNTIELALGKPRSAFGGVDQYPSLADKAAALLYGFAKSQACVDGNKRVALILLVEFLRINGARIQTRPGELADMILAIGESDQATHDHVVLGLAEWMAKRIRRERT